MNTLSRTLTAQFFNTQDDYQALKAHWSKLVNSPRKKELKPEHHLLYAALLGRDWRKGFTPITNRVKLANGMTPGMAQFKALSAIGWKRPKNVERLLEPFDGLVTAEILNALLPFLPDATSKVTDAYIVPEAVNVAA
jgi:hypothetical protein